MNEDVFNMGAPLSLLEQLTHTVEDGRTHLGNEMPVLVYRLFQFAMRDVLHSTYGNAGAIDLFRRVGHKAGAHLARIMLNLDQPFTRFIAQLQSVLLELKVGVLRVEECDEVSGRITLTISEDVDCSGLPILGVPVCNYDEGLIAGVLNAYTHKCYTVREVDCWATGDRVCRFDAYIDEEQAAL